MNDYEGPEEIPIVTWHAKANRYTTGHAFTQAGGWSVCGSIGWSQTGASCKDAKRCGRCVKVLKGRGSQ